MDLRGGGHVDFAYNFFPWMSDLPLRNIDMQQMPGRVLFWMSTLHCDPNLERLLKPEYLNKERSVFAAAGEPLEDSFPHPGNWAYPTGCFNQVQRA